MSECKVCIDNCLGLGMNFKPFLSTFFWVSVRVVSYLPSDPHLAGPTSIYIVKPADQQDQCKNQHFQPHTYYHINFVLVR